jgi:hypothetical protein
MNREVVAQELVKIAKTLVATKQYDMYVGQDGVNISQSLPVSPYGSLSEVISGLRKMAVLVTKWVNSHAKEIQGKTGVKPTGGPSVSDRVFVGTWDDGQLKVMAVAHFSKEEIAQHELPGGGYPTVEAFADWIEKNTAYRKS